MTAAAIELEPRESVPEGESEWRAVWRRLRRKRLAMASLVVIGLIYGAGILAPLIAPYSYNQTNLDIPRQGPSREHLLGTDTLGRDMLSRTMFSARTTLVVTTAVIQIGRAHV